MRFRPAVLVLLLLTCVGASAQTTTNTGTFTLSDSSNIFGQGTTVSLDGTNASFAATATLNTTTPTDVDAIHFAASPAAVSGQFWTFDFDHGATAIQPGTFVVDGTLVTAAVGFINRGTTMVCEAAFGTVTISAMATNPHATTTAVFTNLQGSFQIDCSNVTASLSGTFGFTATTTTPAPQPPPLPPSGGSGNGGLGPVPGLGPFAGTPVTPTTPGTAPTPTPTLSVSGPVQTLLGPVDLVTGQTVTLQFITTTNSVFASDVALSASSDPPGLTFAFNPAKIAAPGSGTTNLMVGTADGALPGDFFVTVIASGGGLTATTTFLVHVFCDPPVILGLNQPQSATISNGGTAQISVTPTGSGPFNYQWYLGHQGSTLFPVDGGTAATLTTSALNSTTQYWVRVSNGCGAVDSETATVNVNP
jgi:hypothetical protein